MLRHLDRSRCDALCMHLVRRIGEQIIRRRQSICLSVLHHKHVVTDLSKMEDVDVGILQSWKHGSSLQIHNCDVDSETGWVGMRRGSTLRDSAWPTMRVRARDTWRQTILHQHPVQGDEALVVVGPLPRPPIDKQRSGLVVEKTISYATW